MGQTVYVFDKRTQKIALADLDVAATIKANDDRGLEFKIPLKSRRKGTPICSPRMLPTRAQRLRKNSDGNALRTTFGPCTLGPELCEKPQSTALGSPHLVACKIIDNNTLTGFRNASFQ